MGILICGMAQRSAYYRNVDLSMLDFIFTTKHTYVSPAVLAFLETGSPDRILEANCPRYLRCGQGNNCHEDERRNLQKQKNKCMKSGP